MQTPTEKNRDNPVTAKRKELVDRIISMMEQDGFFNNRSEWNRLAFAPQNPLSNTVYKGGNRIRLMFEAYVNQYDDPRWATFKQISDAGYKVKKGAHGVTCEKWSFYKEQPVKDSDGNVMKDSQGKTIKETVELEHPVCRMFTVFHASQIEGFPELTFDQNPIQTEMGILADQLIASSECPVKELPQSRAYYSRTKDEIVLPPRSVFKDIESFVKTILHEEGHATGHPDRLNREFGTVFGEEKYAEEELVAEMASLFAESDLGICLQAEHFEDHSDYLKSWIGALKADYSVLFRVVGEAEKAAERIVENYEKIYMRNRRIQADESVQESTETIKHIEGELTYQCNHTSSKANHKTR